MNNNSINGASINGSGLPAWVIQAGVIAAVVAVAVSIEPKRIAYGSALGNAAVTVTVSQNKVVHGFASGICSASADVDANVTFAGSVLGLCGSTGYVSAQRTFQASANGNAGCDGYALVASLLGEATVACGASVVDANAHRVKYGKSNVTCEASGSVSGDVTRYGKVMVLANAINASIDASIQLNGESFYRNDGYCLAYANASGIIDSTKTDVITTLGVFAFGNGSSQAGAFIIYPGKANVTASITAQPVIATFIFNQSASATATTTAISANGVRMVLPSASGSASSKSNNPKARMRYAASCNGMASVSSVKALGGKLLYADSSVIGNAAAINCTATKIQYGAVSTAIATALVGRAYGIANSEISAPDDRYMIVEAVDRTMFIDNDDRMMLVAA